MNRSLLLTAHFPVLEVGYEECNEVSNSFRDSRKVDKVKKKDYHEEQCHTNYKAINDDGTPIIIKYFFLNFQKIACGHFCLLSNFC